MSIDLDSGDQYSRSASAPSFSTVTFCGWINKDTISAEGSIFSRGDGTTVRLVVTAAGKLAINSGGSLILTGTTTLSAATWYHVAMTQNTNDWEIFLNGVSEGTVTNTGVPTGSTIVRFGYDDGAGNYFIGQLASCKVWNAVLNSTEIGTEKDSWAAARTSNIWGYWQWQGGPATTDESGNGNDLTAGGTITTGASNPTIGSAGHPAMRRVSRPPIGVKGVLVN